MLNIITLLRGALPASSHHRCCPHCRQLVTEAAAAAVAAASWLMQQRSWHEAAWRSGACWLMSAWWTWACPGPLPAFEANHRHSLILLLAEAAPAEPWRAWRWQCCAVSQLQHLLTDYQSNSVQRWLCVVQASALQRQMSSDALRKRKPLSTIQQQAIKR
jgi:hypothetical protein